ncbi:hypothetical protein DSECCO2_332840 [anaerobic digester metagenome]
MIDIGIGICAVSLLKDIAKYMKDRSKKDPELFEMVAELQSIIMDMVATNAELTEMVHKLEAKIQLQKTLRFDINTETYWRGKNDGPYCQKCYDKDQKLIRLRNHDAPRWACTTCNSFYFKPRGREIHEEREKQQQIELKRHNEEVRKNNPFRNRFL